MSILPGLLPPTTVLCGDVLEQLRTLPDESVQCCVTSPPYWNLRDYGTAEWEGGDDGCDHKPDIDHTKSVAAKSTLCGTTQEHASECRTSYRDICGKCGARRIDKQIGLEATPEEYIAKMVEVFGEVRRVLRSDGTCWIVIGDTYNAYNGNRGKSTSFQEATEESLPSLPGGYGLTCKTLKPKDLCGIPWRLAFALQDDGWWLRSDIIWHKPNPMPESVTDRPTKSHEYVFLLTKNARYFYDNEAVREDGKDWSKGGPGTGILPTTHYHPDNGGNSGLANLAARYKTGEQTPSRNLRSVWTIPTQSYPEAHFATYPENLVQTCLSAGTSAWGCCATCGAPWERVTESERVPTRPGTNSKINRASDDDDSPYNQHSGMVVGNRDPKRHCTVTATTGWQATCDHGGEPIPCTILDPFCGSGTTLLVARRMGLASIGIELNPEYVELIHKRLA